MSTRHGTAAVGKTPRSIIQICSFNIARQPRVQVIPRHGKAVGENTSVEFQVYRSSITFECMEKGSTPAANPQGTAQYFRSVGAQVSISLQQWEFIYHSIIHFSLEVRHAMRKSELKDFWRSLNREIATASPVNHNKDPSGSVRE